MKRTLKEKLKAKINASPRGKLFLISDFESLGNYSSIRWALSELEKEGLLLRVHLGIYQKPNYSDYFKQLIPATPTEIAAIVARKNKWQIAPAKDLALNLLGLDTQIPNSYDFISSGPSKTIKLDDGRKIHFRNVVPREILMKSTSSLVIEAFKQLGEKRVTQEILQQVASKLTTQQLQQLEKDSKNSRVWIKEIIKQMKAGLA